MSVGLLNALSNSIWLENKGNYHLLTCIASPTVKTVLLGLIINISEVRTSKMERAGIYGGGRITLSDLEVGGSFDNLRHLGGFHGQLVL